MKNILRITLNIFLICFILAGAVILRVLYIKNTIGLTLTEIDIYQNAFNPKEIQAWKSILRGEPVFSLYNIILSCWNTFIPDNTYYLRGLSVIFGIITCFFSYFAGKKFQGFLCLILFSLNSFLINYSQEVGMYSLLGMFATLNIVSLIKIKNTDKAYWIWIISVIGMLLTSLPTLLFVCAEIIIFSIYQRKKKFIFISALAFLLNLPYFAYVIFNYKKYSELFSGINYDYANSFGFLQNCFTPKLIELNLNNYVHYFQSLFMEINFYSLGFILIPAAIALYFIFEACVKNKFNILLILISFTYVALRITLQILFGTPFNTGEYILILPIFLIIFSYGIEKNVASISLLVLFIFMNAFCLGFQENSAMKNRRISALSFSEIVNKTVKDNDILLLWINLNGTDKVINKKVTISSMSDTYIKNSSLINENKADYEKMNERKRKDFLREKFLKKQYPESTLLESNLLLSQLNKDNNLYIIYPKQYDYNYDNFLDMVSKDYLYYKHKENDLMLYHVISQLKIMLADRYQGQEEKNNIVVNIYKK